MPCPACGCDPCIKMPRCRYPYSHDGPAVYGSKLADYLISEANMNAELDRGICHDHDQTFRAEDGCPVCNVIGEREALRAEIARLREALGSIAPWLSASLSPKELGGLGCDAGPEYRAACDAVFAALGEGEG